MKTRKVRTARDAVDGYLLSLPPKEFKYISPSQLGGCFRSHYWKIKGVKPTTPPDLASLANFQVGFLWEEFMANAFEQQGMLVKHFVDGQDEPFHDPESGLGGLPDILISRDGKVVCLDSKTVNSAYFKFASRFKKFDDWVNDNMSYVYQQVAYVHLLRLNGYDVDTAILSFASKDSGVIGLEFEIEVTDDLVKQVLDRASRLKRYLSSNELPPCSCEGWKVNYCDYGNPDTMEPNRKKKIVPTECCEPAWVLP